MVDTIAVIQARMGSTRFPGKSLALLYGRAMLEWVIDAARRICQTVVVATTEDEEDGPIADCAIANAAEVFRKGLRPLMLYDWYLRIAEEYQPEYIVRICGDTPLLDSDVGRMMLAMRPCDYASPKIGGTLGVLTEYGVTCELFSAAALRRMAGLKSFHMHHCTSAFYMHRNNHICLFPVDDLACHQFRGTVDYPEDLQRLEAAIRQYGHFPANYKEAIECLCT